MSKKKKERASFPGDDGRTVADMSGVERRNLFLFRDPRLESRERDQRSEAGDAENGAPAERPWEEGADGLSKADTRRTVVAAIGAALLVASVFLVVFAIVIFIMIKAWT